MSAGEYGTSIGSLPTNMNDTITINGPIGIGSGYTVTTGSIVSPYPWSSINDNTIISTSGANHAAIKVTGDAEFDGDITIKGKSLTESLEGIEKRLGILHVNPDLEGRWEKLKKLGERYRAMEKDLLDKEKMWDILKK